MTAPLKIGETLAHLARATRALDEPPTPAGPNLPPPAARPSASTALPRCHFCKEAIDGRAWTGSYRGEATAAHLGCWENFKARSAQKAAELEQFARARVAAFTSGLPVFAVRHDAPEFGERVRHPHPIAAARRYEIGRGSVAFVGPSGCGKTTAAAAIALRLADEAVASFRVSMGSDAVQLERMAHAYWTTAAALCIARKQHRLGEGEAPEFARAETAPLLFLDELGQEIADDRWLLEFLDARQALGLPTITTSGIARTQLEARYGAGAYRRLTEPRGVCIDLFDAVRPRLVSNNG